MAILPSANSLRTSLALMSTGLMPLFITVFQRERPSTICGVSMVMLPSLSVQ